MKPLTSEQLRLFNDTCAEIVGGASFAKAAMIAGVSRGSFYTWLSQHEELRAPYLAACSIRALGLAEKMLDELDELDRAETNEKINAIRAKIDVYKWTSARLQPKVYGDKIQVEQKPPEPLPQTREQLISAADALLLALGLPCIDQDAIAAEQDAQDAQDAQQGGKP